MQMGLQSGWVSDVISGNHPSYTPLRFVLTQGFSLEGDSSGYSEATDVAFSYLAIQ
jgi:hypothetical protein